MAHGQPDYGMYTSKKTVYALTDMAELAARLGSPITYDRRGDVIFYDSFDVNLSAFYTDASGAGGSVAQSNARSRTGGYSAALVCGSNLLRYALIYKYLPYPILSKIGLEFSFTMDNDLEALDIEVRLYDGTTYAVGRIYYDEDNKVLYYYDSAGAWQVLDAALNFYNYDYLFNVIKIVVDGVKDEYVRVLVNENSYNMADIAMRSVASVNNPHLMIMVTATGVAAKNATIYLDDFIVTQNEP